MSINGAEMAKAAKISICQVSLFLHYVTILPHSSHYCDKTEGSQNLFEVVFHL